MHLLNRRSFTKQLLIGSFFPLVQLEPQTAQRSIAGYTLSVQERELLQKFLDGHEKRLAPLRTNDLPNDLPPAILYASPKMRIERGRADDR